MRRTGLYLISLLLLVLEFSPVHAQTQLFDILKLSGLNQLSTDEYGPMYFKRGIVFVSDRRRGAIDKYDNSDDLTPMSNYYFATIDKEGTVSKVELLDLGLVSRSNKGPVVFSTDRKTMYFTKNDLEPGRFRSSHRDNPAGIYTAELKGNRWKDIKPFPYCIGKYNYGHPALTADGSRLYFSSDTPGGSGGFDIWYCDYKDGQWAPPVNAGPKINTAGDEGYPFCHESGRLYFSSNGKSGRGKKSHIYYSELVKGAWIEPIALPEPFNTRFSTKGFIADSSLSSGYFVEERRNKGNVFAFRTRYSLFQNPAPVKEPKLCFRFYDENASLPDTLLMTFEWDFGALGKVRGKIAHMCFPGPGTYNVDLNVIDKLTGAVNLKQDSYPIEIEDIKQVRIKGPASCNLNEKVHIAADISALKDVTVDQYFWRIGELDVATGPDLDYTFTHPGKYTIICRLEATDSKKNPVHPAICNFITIEVKDATLSP